MKKTFKLIVIYTFWGLSTVISAKSEFLRVEIQCPDSFKPLKKGDLCLKKPCPWNLKSQSSTASIWMRGPKELEAIEVPNQKLVRFKYFKGEQRLPLNWCSLKGNASLGRLKQDDLKKLKEKGATLYLLSQKSKNSAGTWNMLKEIKNPCRSLKTRSGPHQMTWAYLLPIEKKACD